MKTFWASIVVVTLAVAAFADEPRQHRVSEPSLSEMVYQPLVIVGEGWSQEIIIQNIGPFRATPLSGKLEFFDASGQPWAVDVQGYGKVTEVPIDVPVYGSLTVTTMVFQTPQVLGWARLQFAADVNERNFFHAYTIYRRQIEGLPDQLTSAPLSNITFGPDSVLYYDNTDGKFAGVALLNPLTDKHNFVDFKVKIYDETGELLRVDDRKLQKGELWWFSLIAEYPETVGKRGQIVVQGWEIQAFSLQFTPRGAFTAISTVEGI